MLSHIQELVVVVLDFVLEDQEQYLDNRVSRKEKLRITIPLEAVVPSHMVAWNRSQGQNLVTAVNRGLNRGQPQPLPPYRKEPVG